VNPFAASFAAAAILLSSFGGVPSAMALDEFDFGTDQVVAARSGGRGGGRARAAAPRPSARPRTTVNNYAAPRAAAPTVIVTPGMGYGGGYGYSPFGYSPFGGLGLGLNVMGGISREMREIQEQKEIARTREELDAAERRSMDLEMRIRSMEAQQAAERGVAPATQGVAPQVIAPQVLQPAQ